MKKISAVFVGGALLMANTLMAKGFTYTDQAGVETKFKQVPKRIATIATPSGSMVVAVDKKGDKLVATSLNSKKAIEEGVLNEFFPVLNRLSSQIIKNKQANVEELLNLHTDLVIEWSRNTKSMDLVRKVGINAIGLKYKKIDIAKTWINDIGIILQKQDNAKEILDWHKKRHAYIVSKTKTIKDSQKPKVMYLLTPTKAAGGKSHFQFFMDTAGAKNAIEGNVQGVEVDAEMILKANPDIIWLFGFNLKLTPDVIYNNPIYSQINAVKNKRIYKVPVGGDRWDPPNQEFVLGQEWFTRTVHPRLLKGTIRQSIKKSFPMLYGQSPTDGQIDLMLRSKLNKGAKDYEFIIQ